MAPATSPPNSNLRSDICRSLPRTAGTSQLCGARRILAVGPRVCDPLANFPPNSWQPRVARDGGVSQHLHKVWTRATLWRFGDQVARPPLAAGRLACSLGCLSTSASAAEVICRDSCLLCRAALHRFCRSVIGAYVGLLRSTRVVRYSILPIANFPQQRDIANVVWSSQRMTPGSRGGHRQGGRADCSRLSDGHQSCQWALSPNNGMA